MRRQSSVPETADYYDSDVIDSYGHTQAVRPALHREKSAKSSGIAGLRKPTSRSRSRSRNRIRTPSPSPIRTPDRQKSASTRRREEARRRETERLWKDQMEKDRKAEAAALQTRLEEARAERERLETEKLRLWHEREERKEKRHMELEKIRGMFWNRSDVKPRDPPPSKMPKPSPFSELCRSCMCYLFLVSGLAVLFLAMTKIGSLVFLLNFHNMYVFARCENRWPGYNAEACSDLLTGIDFFYKQLGKLFRKS